MAYTRDWDESQPTDNEYGYTTGSWFRKVKIDIAQRLKDWIYGFISGETKIGLKKAPLHPVSSDPATESDKGILYVKEVDGVKELFYKDSGGNVKQLTSQGKLNLTDEGVVYLTGDQTINGVKTFNSFPVTPSANPSSDYEVANKKYVDDKISSLPSPIGGLDFGVPVSKNAGTVYHADAPGFVVAYTNPTGGGSGVGIIGYSDSSNPPSTIRQRSYVDVAENGTVSCPITFPVKKGDYWKVVSQNASATIWWIPLEISYAW